MGGSLLIVDDEKHTREGLAEAFEKKFNVSTAASAEEAFRRMEEESFDVLLTDLRMGAQSGLTVIDKALSLPQKPTVIVMTAYGNIETAVEAMKRGAYDFLSKPIHLGRLEVLLQRAFEARQIVRENGELHRKLSDRYRVEGILGESRNLRAVLEQVEKVAGSRTTVLLLGETGTGKELIARRLHQKSPRRNQPFVAVHCAALSSGILESELWGHEKGAFTGAVGRRVGRFETANRGTLFLDEIGEIDAAIQVKLLRFLETRTIERLGSSQSIPLDVRLICATHRNLEQMVGNGTFREDLLYRLNVVVIRLPALRERPDDIPLLLEHYLKLFGEENGVRPVQISSPAMKQLLRYRWPGNVRELRNFAENITVMRPGRTLLPGDLEHRFLDTPSQIPSINASERELIADALTKTRNNKTKAAQLLGIDRRTLHRKLKRWEITEEG
jgi:DNA-binding NtrC family response regulator